MMPRAAVAHVLRVSSSHRHTNAIRLLSSTSSSSSTPLADAEQLQHQPNRQLIEACENLDIEQVVHSLNAGADPYTTPDAPAPPLVVSLYDHTLISALERAFTVIDAVSISRGQTHNSTPAIDRAMIAMGLLKKNRKLFNSAFYVDEGNHPVFDQEDDDAVAANPSTSSSSTPAQQ
jgi:hypothetical protein